MRREKFWLFFRRFFAVVLFLLPKGKAVEVLLVEFVATASKPGITVLGEETIAKCQGNCYIVTI